MSQDLAARMLGRTPQDVERARLSADAALLDAYRPQFLEARAKAARERTSRQKRERAEEYAAQRTRDLDLLKERPAGPNLAPYQRQNRAAYVVEADLDGFIPDGWGRIHRDNAARWAARLGLASWVDVLLLVTLRWVHGLKAGSARSWTLPGCGAQLSPEWLARKFGCDVRSIYRAINRLDPHAEHRRELAEVRRKNADRDRRGLPLLPAPPRPAPGVSFVQRFRQLRRYRNLVRDLPWAQRTDHWRDASGTLRQWVDLTGVFYVTAMGARLLRPRRKHAARPRKGTRPALLPNLAEQDLCKRLAPTYRTLRARLAPAATGGVRPINVNPSVTEYVGAPGREKVCPSGTDSGSPRATDAPAGDFGPWRAPDTPDGSGGGGVALTFAELASMARAPNAPPGGVT